MRVVQHIIFVFNKHHYIKVLVLAILESSSSIVIIAFRDSPGYIIRSCIQYLVLAVKGFQHAMRTHHLR